MIPKRIISFLDKKGAKYETVEHRTVYTAFDKAKTLKIKEAAIGKTVIFRVGKKEVLILIPSDKNLDIKKFKSLYNALGKKRGEKPAKDFVFAKEAWIKKNLTGSKIGSVPPFGEIWELETFADRALTKNAKIILNSGDHENSLRMTPSAFKKANPDLITGSFSAKKPAKAKKKQPAKKKLAKTKKRPKKKK